ncbi:hypothetical protein BDW75DRAFT_204794 [Aspergillus navahoensis]
MQGKEEYGSHPAQHSALQACLLSRSLPPLSGLGSSESVWVCLASLEGKGLPLAAELLEGDWSFGRLRTDSIVGIHHSVGANREEDRTKDLLRVDTAPNSIARPEYGRLQSRDRDQSKGNVCRIERHYKVATD